MTRVEDFLTFCKCFLENDFVQMSVKAFDHSGKEVFTTVDLTAKMSTLELVEMWENEKKLGFFWDTK